MKEESCDEELHSDPDTNSDQSWARTAKTPTKPFSNFYATKQSSSSDCGSQYKLSEQLANISSNVHRF